LMYRSRYKTAHQLVQELHTKKYRLIEGARKRSSSQRRGAAQTPLMGRERNRKQARVNRCHRRGCIPPHGGPASGTRPSLHKRTIKRNGADAVVVMNFCRSMNGRRRERLGDGRRCGSSGVTVLVRSYRRSRNGGRGSVSATAAEAEEDLIHTKLLVTEELGHGRTWTEKISGRISGG
jgi:hypothetical protein